MHEFSLAVDLISLARREAEKIMAETIHEITIEVGDLSGVDANAFESALGMLVMDSILENTIIRIIRTPGIGKCNACDHEFEMNQRMAACPRCQAFPSEISGGKDIKVVSMLIE